jgi:hypothetical protein
MLHAVLLSSNFFQRRCAVDVGQKEKQNGESQTIIAATCAYVEGELYLWGVPGTRLEDVQIERQAFLGSERSYLQITFGEAASRARDSVTGSRLWRTKKLSIRIPPGQDLTAQAVLEQLKSRISS